jgi:hypothetical protein
LQESASAQAARSVKIGGFFPCHHEENNSPNARGEIEIIIKRCGGGAGLKGE